MPLPKRRHTKTRRDKSRTHQRLKTNSLSICPQCKTPKMPHRVCPVCGYYKKTKYIEFKDETKEKKQ
ncbi:MAG: 50S ribosomal protein L32 [Candidatus Omnitrophota bacterium]